MVVRAAASNALLTESVAGQAFAAARSLECTGVMRELLDVVGKNLDFMSLSWADSTLNAMYGPDGTASVEEDANGFAQRRCVTV